MGEYGNLMAMRSKKQSMGDGAMRAFLARYACPLSYHQVRARFMGNIATPDMDVSPMREIQRIWNNDLPVFESKAEAEEFFSVLMKGVWNALSDHQNHTSPFELARVKTAAASYEYLARLGRIRHEEIEGFIDGLFAGQDEIDLPESAHKAVGVLGELRGLFAATEDLANSPPGPASVSSLEHTAKHLRELSRIAEHEINVIIQACKKARAQALETLSTGRPPILH
jgi:hypothetical protein